MKKLILCLALASCQPALANPYDRGMPSCIEQDWLGIEDDGPEKAIVTYSNSIEACSVSQSVILTAPNGIEVRVTITVNTNEESSGEEIILIPVDPNFMSFPPEGNILDGERATFQIMGGMS